MSHRTSDLLAGALVVLLLAAFAPAAFAPAAFATPVSVRVAGDAVGIDTTQVETTADPVGPGGCPGHSAGGALDKAIAGNWDQLAFTQTILGETHAYTVNDYWNFWINDTYSQEGLCTYTVVPGDRILVLVQRDDPTTFAPTVFPLTISGVPASGVAGVPITVRVSEQRTDATTTTPTPLAGATVSGAGASAVSDAAGFAKLTPATPGAATLRATRAGNVASDAYGLTIAAPSPGQVIAPPHGSDRVAPAASIRGIADGQRFARGAAPRRLRATIAPDPSGLFAVKLRLTRADRGRCTYFSGRSERFRVNVKNRCRAESGWWFGVGASANVDYLLPGRLPRGRYVLDVNAIDKAYNRDDARRRGANRVVFHVG